MARLAAEQKFHGSEFSRYNRQQKWNDDRIKNETDESKTMAQRVRADMEMDEQARIDIDNGDAHINYNQNLRNPANRIAARAKRIFDEENNKAWKARVDQINAVKIPPQPKAVVTRRGLQAKTRYTGAQTIAIKEMKALWAKRAKDLQTQIDLNLKFHSVEFEEFILDTHRVKDIEQIMESDLALNEKRTLVWHVWAQYDAIKAPTKNIINAANNARKKAQDVLNGNENQVVTLARRNREFAWATEKGRRN